MLELLQTVEYNLFELLFGFESKNIKFHTKYIDYHEPFVKRIWFETNKIPNARIYLHDITKCYNQKPLYHPHPWESAMRIIEGQYEMGLGYNNPESNLETISTIILNEGSSYEMVNVNGWHYVNPIDEKAVSLMVTGKLYDIETPSEFKPNKQFRTLLYIEILDIIKSVCKHYNFWNGIEINRNIYNLCDRIYQNN